MGSNEITMLSGKYGLTSNAGQYFVDKKEATNFVLTDVTAYREPGSDKDAVFDIAVKIEGKDFLVNIEVDRSDFTAQILDQVPYATTFKPDVRGRLDALIAACALRQNAAAAPYFRRDGLYRLTDGKYVYVAGTEVLGADSNLSFRCAPALSTHRLAADDGLSECDALSTFLGTVQNCPEALITFLYTMLCALRSAVVPLGLSIFPSLYIVGAQGTGKTTMATRFCTLFDYCSGSTGTYGKMESCSTDKGIYRCLGAYRDMAALVDDLAIGSSASVQTERTALISHILRFAANDNTRATGRTDNAGEQSCQAGVVFTGEVPLTAASDLTRLLILPLSHHMRGGKPQDRAVAATLLRNWMLWLLPNLEKELETLRLKLAETQGALDPRLIQTGQLFCWCADVFLRYACEKGRISSSDYTHAYSFVQERLQTLLRTQQEKADRASNRSPQGNVFWYLLRAYQSGFLRIVSKEKKLEDDRDCLMSGNTLYVKSAAVVDYLKHETPLPAITKNRLGKLLSEYRIIPPNAESRSAGARINGVRYLPINLPALKAAAVKY